jgi:hypothetical protein
MRNGGRDQGQILWPGTIAKYGQQTQQGIVAMIRQKPWSGTAVMVRTVAMIRNRSHSQGHQPWSGTAVMVRTVAISETEAMVRDISHG